jgi:xeroderma pigmentosum group C-complementing protein
MKMVKVRPGTVSRMREIEIVKDGLREAGEASNSVDVMQGLYARSQTERYVPVPVIDVSSSDFSLPICFNIVFFFG